MCSGLTNSRDSCVSPSLGCLEVNHLRPKTLPCYGKFTHGEDTDAVTEGATVQETKDRG